MTENGGSDLATLLIMIFVAFGLFFVISRFGLWQQDSARGASPISPPEGGFTPEHRIFVLQGGQQRGPYTALEVGEMLRSGKLRADALCWQPGQQDWLPVGKVHGQA